MTEINDKTSSVFVTRQAFDDAARECKLETDVAEQLWSKLANTSTQRIIGGATAPRQDGVAQ